MNATGYVTDAEKFGWSIVQQTVYQFEVVEGANWKKPDGLNEAKMDVPVTQVSYNDAIAYCQWKNVRLPNYEVYWELVASDTRGVNINASSILPAMEVNTVGNTWDITESRNENDEIRLAGGSYLCSITTCDGTNINRELYVSRDTGNSNISFSVISN